MNCKRITKFSSQSFVKHSPNSLDFIKTIVYNKYMGKPRYSRESDLFEIMLSMAARPQGITLNEIVKEYGITYNTAVRLRDSLMNVFPQIDELYRDENNRKHYGFINYSLKSLVNFNSNDMLSLLQSKNLTVNADLEHNLNIVLDKINLLLSKETRQSIETLFAIEKCAIKQQPMFKIRSEFIQTVRKSILENKKLKGYYKNQTIKILKPLGIVLGNKTYLIAIDENKDNQPKSYILHKFENLQILEETFDKPTFDLQQWINESFGIWHGDRIMKIKLIFDKDVADDAANYYFHPTQKGKFDENGNYLLSFKASGSREIMYNLFTWGKHVKIIAPVKFQRAYKKYLREIYKIY